MIFDDCTFKIAYIMLNKYFDSDYNIYSMAYY